MARAHPQVVALRRLAHHPVGAQQPDDTSQVAAQPQGGLDPAIRVAEEMQIVHADGLGRRGLLRLPDRCHLGPGHRPVAAAGVTVGHDAIADIETRVGPGRNRPGRAEVHVVRVRGDDQNPADFLFFSHPPILRDGWGVYGGARPSSVVPGGLCVTLVSTRTGCPARRLSVNDVGVVATFSTDRSYAQALDAADQLASFRDRFARYDRDLIYLDGNSLGPLPVRTQARIAEVVDQDWGVGLVRSWDKWIQLPRQAGDMVGEHLVGAAAGQVLVCDSVTVNLYKLACAALDAKPGRNVIITDDDNFPTDRYVLAGVAAQRGCELRIIHTDMDDGVSEQALDGALDDRVALVSLSHVAYRSGALADMAAITDQVHLAGAYALWDLSHAAGAVPVELDANGVDLAVGCTYKYLNAGPGAPSFIYVREELQHKLRQPIWGWFGQRDQFAMGPAYDPAPGIDSFLTGTPDIIGAVAVEEGARGCSERPA